MVGSRLARNPPTRAALAVAVLVVTAGGAMAFNAASALERSAAVPALTADAPAPCNTPRPQGLARCLAVIRTPANHRITTDTAGPPTGALGPGDIQSAYNLPATGSGQTVALVDAYGDTDAESNLASFRSHYGLPPCTTVSGCFRKVNQQGREGDYPPNNAGWGVETSLDLDAVSSACPKCNILLVETAGESFADLGTAVDEAVRLGAKFISNSYGASESPNELGLDHYYDHPGIAVTASAGDNGYGTLWPSASQYVTAAGGTTLTKDPSVPRGWAETVWGLASGGAGTGSGCSPYEPKPADQDGVATDCPKRAVADLAADANPASGLAVYDTLGYDGWLQVGGTSLASPLIAAAYALAGAPVAGTYPASYPYHDPNQSKDLFDITRGINGDCGTVLCRAGKGWDGPTGLGSPDGIDALTSGPQGRIIGHITSKTTGRPLPGAIVSASPGDYLTRTDAHGVYELDVTTGNYKLTATDFGYSLATRSRVRVASGQATTENFALAARPHGALSGTVTDGSGHGWPLHARVVISGYSGGAVWTSPYSGQYHVALPQGRYSVSVAADYPGYRTTHLHVVVGADTIRDVALTVNKATCAAPGYGPDGLTQDFAGWRGGTPEEGWRVMDDGHGSGWRFDNPGNRPPPPLRATRLGPGFPLRYTEFVSDQFAVADAGLHAPQPLATTLISPPVSLAGQTAPEIAFDSAYYPDGSGARAYLQLSDDRGLSWVTVWRQSTGNALGPVTIPIPQAAGQTRVQIRFGFAGGGDGYWAVADVMVGTPGCGPLPGGLLAGEVDSQATSQPIDGAQIVSSAHPQPQAWPAGISLTTSDASLPGGFYWLFAPAGSQRVTANAAGFRTASTSVSVAANQVTRDDWKLARVGGG